MNCPTGHIVVWVQLSPSRVEEGAGVNICARDEHNWVRCLNINTSHVLEFSAKPYKWIRFVTGALMGTEGILCDSDDADAPEINYDRPLIPGDSSLYFCTTPADLERIYPLDPDLADTYTSTGSERSTHCNEFMDDIINRDGRCVASQSIPRICDAAHLIAHSKGDAYIEALTNARSRAPNGDDCIDDIDDIRNGLLLNKGLHSLLASCDVAFLVIPNFAMSTSDVDPNLGPDEPRWTVHDFYRVSQPSFTDPSYRVNVPHNHSLHVPTSLNDWPPRTIFDVVYASAVYKHYHHEEFANILRTHWRNGIYLDGVNNTHIDSDMAKINRRKAARNARKADNDLKRQERPSWQWNSREETEGMDTLDVLFAASQMVARPPPTKEQLEARKKQQEELKAAEEESWAAEQKNLHNNVTAWLGIQT